MIDGARLRQAREARGLTQKALAERTGLPQPVVSRAEIGSRLLEGEDIQRLADALEIPLRFLERSPTLLPEGSLGLFRAASSKVRSLEFTAARRGAEIGAEAILRLAEGVDLPAVRIQTIRGADVEEAARFAREALRLPPGEPIPNLTASLERAGVLVLRLSGLSEHIAGFSAWLSVPDRPLIATRRPLGPFRLRFTLGHELGHLVLGHQVFAGPQRPEEREANLFASALLMPREAAEEDLTAMRLDFERVAELKGKWGLSMHAIAMRAKALGILDEGGYRSFYEGLRTRGWLRREPGDASTPAENPRLLRELAERQGVPATAYDLAERLDVGLPDMRALLGEEPDALGLPL